MENEVLIVAVPMSGKSALGAVIVGWWVEMTERGLESLRESNRVFAFLSDSRWQETIKSRQSKEETR